MIGKISHIVRGILDASNNPKPQILSAPTDHLKPSAADHDLHLAVNAVFKDYQTRDNAPPDKNN